MHVNYRRKKRSRHKLLKGWLVLPRRYTRIEQRLRWKKVRQAVRGAMTHSEFDKLPGRYPQQIRWDYW